MLKNVKFQLLVVMCPDSYGQPENQSFYAFEDTSEVEADGGHFDVEAVA